VLCRVGGQHELFLKWSSHTCSRATLLYHTRASFTRACVGARSKSTSPSAQHQPPPGLTLLTKLALLFHTAMLAPSCFKRQRREDCLAICIAVETRVQCLKEQVDFSRENQKSSRHHDNNNDEIYSFFMGDSLTITAVSVQAIVLQSTPPRKHHHTSSALRVANPLIKNVVSEKQWRQERNSTIVCCCYSSFFLHTLLPRDATTRDAHKITTTLSSAKKLYPSTSACINYRTLQLQNKSCWNALHF